MNVKRLRRFLSVLLSMSMVLSLNTASFAAEVGDAAADAQVHTEAEPEEIPETEAADPQAELNEASLEEAPQEETSGSEQAEHVHDWVRIEDMRAPTCTKAGVAVYKCQNDGCDAVKGQRYETIPKLGHKFDPDAADYEEGKGYDTKVIEPATCKQEGSVEYTCRRETSDGATCDEVTTATTPKTDHQWEEEAREVGPNCLEAAKSYIKCKFCDAVKPGSATYDETNPALGHGYDRENAAEDTDYTVEETQATCTTDGGKEYTCLHCDADTEGHTWIPENEKVKALGHGYDRKGAVENTDYTKTVEPAGCLTDGYTEYVCKDPNCPSEDKGKVKRNTVKALGHGYARANAAVNKDYTVETVTANCTTDGYTEYTCKYCSTDVEGHTSRINVVKGGHKWSTEKVEVSEANCKDPAKYDYVCSVCQAEKGDSETRGTADADSHVYDKDDPEFSSVFKPATCKINGLTRLTCTFCKNATKFEIVKAAHDYKTTENIAATCTEDGTITKVCKREDCDDLDTKTVTTHPQKTGHNYKSETTTAATCIAKGIITKTCQNEGCDSVLTDDAPIDPTNHTNWSEDGKHEATCTTPEITGKYCLDCGTLHPDAKKTANAKGHVFDRMSNDEFEEYVKNLNKEPEVPEVPETQANEDGSEDGKPEYVKVTQEATCKEEGTKLYTCPDCNEKGNTKEVSIAKKSHTWDPDKAYVAPTCTENGKHVEICINCGAKGVTTDLGIMGDEYKATGHKYTVLVDTFREETCVKNGVAQYKCATCDLTKNAVIPAAHKYETVESESTPATCTEAGKEVKECKRETCDDPENKKIETPLNALGHDFDEGTVTTAATCATKGVLTKTCQRGGCNKTETADIAINPSNHQNMQSVSNQEATCTVPKIISGSYCDACGKLSDDAVTEGTAKGHAFERMTDEEFEEYAKSLADDPTHAGKEYVKTTEPATCTETGKKLYTCPDCGVANNTKVITIPALQHDFKDKYTSPTCTENGKVQQVCSREGCDAVSGPAEDLGTLDPKLGHNIVTTKGKKATCQEKGLTDGKACDRKGCGYAEVAQKEIPVDKENGHDWSGVGLDDEHRPATCTKPGYSILHCSVEGCDEEKTEVLEAGHDWKEYFAGDQGKLAWADDDTVMYRVCSRAGAEDCDAEPYEVLLVMPGAGYCEECEMYVWKEAVPGKPATCTKDGLTDGEKCPNEDCTFVFKKQDTINKLGHKNTTWQTEKAPTCKEPGTEKEICGVCNEATGQTRPVAATGNHQYIYKLTDATCTTNDTINSVCKTCGQLNPNNVPEELPGTALGHKFGDNDVCVQCHKSRAYAQTTVTAYKDGDKNRVRFTATAGVADEEKYQLLDRGIIYITDKAYCENTQSDGKELVYENVGKNAIVRALHFPEDRKEDTYYVAINVTNNENRVLWARAFTVVMNLDTGEQEVWYGDILHASYNSVAGAAN